MADETTRYQAKRAGICTDKEWVDTFSDENLSAHTATGSPGPRAISPSIRTKRSPAGILLAWVLACSLCPADFIPLANAEVEPTAPGAQPDIECDNADPLVKKLFFGDLHIHTRYSMDAYSLETRSTPWDTYAFARGGTIGLGPVNEMDEPTRKRRLLPSAKIDFAAVTDHAEYLGEVALCTEPDLRPESYDTWQCADYRENGSLTQFSAARPSREPMVCGSEGQHCTAAASTVWQDTITAANTSNAPCEFSAFIGYEWSASPGVKNLHRTIIFRNEIVPAVPFSAYASVDPQELWDSLDGSCTPGSGCQAITIPHNSNLSQGTSLQLRYPPGASVEEQLVLAQQRERIERLLEIIQQKGSSECFPNFTTDEQCDFELLDADSSTCVEGIPPGAGESCIAEIDSFRGALKVGLLEESRLGVNPLRLGAMASTDTHNGTAGDVAEYRYAGHAGTRDSNFVRRLFSNPRVSPGGLVAVWASQNTRDAVYDALWQRETYGTSGTRLAVRFFGGDNFSVADCQSPEVALNGYEKGVPMGGIVSAIAPENMSFLIEALPDQVPIDRVQVIKGYLDEWGDLHETILEDGTLRHDLPVGAVPSCDEPDVDCSSLCGVIQDPNFEPGQLSFYYLRVLEHETPRWSTYDCNFSERISNSKNCQPGVLPETIQERAWTSPIWYIPPV